MKRYEQRLAQKYGPPKKRLAVKDIEAVMVSVAAGEYVKHTDHLAAVSAARADALRWVLGQIGRIEVIDTEMWIINYIEELIEKELSK